MKYFPHVTLGKNQQPTPGQQLSRHSRIQTKKIPSVFLSPPNHTEFAKIQCLTCCITVFSPGTGRRCCWACRAEMSSRTEISSETILWFCSLCPSCAVIAWKQKAFESHLPFKTKLISKQLKKFWLCLTLCTKSYRSILARHIAEKPRGTRQAPCGILGSSLSIPGASRAWHLFWVSRASRAIMPLWAKISKWKPHLKQGK